MLNTVIFRKNGIYEELIQTAITETGADVFVLSFEENATQQEIRNGIENALELGFIPAIDIGVTLIPANSENIMIDITCLRVMGRYFLKNSDCLMTLDYLVSKGYNRPENKLPELVAKIQPKQIFLVKEQLEDHAYSVGGHAAEFWSEVILNATGIVPTAVSFRELPVLDAEDWVFIDRHASRTLNMWPNGGVVLEVPQENLAESLGKYGVSIGSDCKRRVVDSIKGLLIEK